MQSLAIRRLWYSRDGMVSPANFVRIEAQALEALAHRLDGEMRTPFEKTLQLLMEATERRSRVVVTGMGKSGIIAQKITAGALFSSTGTPALFLHPAEALHGDIGVIDARQPGHGTFCQRRDRRNPAPAGASQADSATRWSASAVIPVRRSVVPAMFASIARLTREACTLDLAPTASTTVMLALGDALALAVAERRGFKPEDFRPACIPAASWAKSWRALRT